MNTTERGARQAQRDEKIARLRADMLDRKERRLGRSLPGWRNRAHRRPLVVLFLLIVAAMLTGAHLLTTGTGLALDWGVGVLVSLVPWVLLRILTRGVAETAPAQLDERDRGLRNRVLYRAYVTAIVAMGLAVGYLTVNRHLPDLADHACLFLLVLLWASSAAPTMFLAWTLPDDDPEDLAEPTDSAARTDRADAPGGPEGATSA